MKKTELTAQKNAPPCAQKRENAAHGRKKSNAPENAGEQEVTARKAATPPVKKPVAKRKPLSGKEPPQPEAKAEKRRLFGKGILEQAQAKGKAAGETDKKHKRMRLFYRCLVWLGLIMMADTCAIYFVTNRHLGVYLPFLLGLPLAIWGLAGLKGKKGLRKTANWVGFVCYGFFTATLLPALCLMLFVPAPAGKADAVIVCGAGLNNGNVTLIYAHRLQAGLDFALAHKSVVIATGGVTPGNGISEGEAGRNWLVSNGLPPENALAESTSTSTRENMRNAKTILDAQFARQSYTVAVATNRFHCWRALREAKLAGYTVAGALPANGVWFLVPNDFLREYVAIYRTLLLG